MSIRSRLAALATALNYRKQHRGEAISIPPPIGGIGVACSPHLCQRTAADLKQVEEMMERLLVKQT